jgi:pyridoxal 5'-phosphate synthase pdxS subunit
MNKINSGIAELKRLLAKGDMDALDRKARQYRVPLVLVEKTAKLGRLPVVNFAAGGIATPADAALMMQMGADGVFVGSGIFKSTSPAKTAKAIVEAVLHYDDPKLLAKVSTGLGDPMKGMDVRSMEDKHRLAHRGI